MVDQDLTLVLERVGAGDQQAQEELFALAYEELRELAARLMRRERQDHTLQPTALVNEAALKVFQPEALSQVPNRSYFFGAMAQAMRRILVDYARKRHAQRRGGSARREPLDETLRFVEENSGANILALDEALSRLQLQDERTYQVVMLRFFAGLEHKEIASQLNVSVSTVDRDWRFAKAWLRNEME